MSIPFIDLKAQFHHLQSEIRTAINTLLTHETCIMGSEVDEMEAKLGEFSGVGNVVSCASGTDALLMCLMTNDVGPGDAVFVPTFTLIARAEVIALLGATPVFVDIHEDGFNIDPVALSRALESVDGGALRPRGVVAVDIFAVSADYDRVMSVTEEHGMFVIADAAQTAVCQGHDVGSRP